MLSISQDTTAYAEQTSISTGITGAASRAGTTCCAQAYGTYTSSKTLINFLSAKENKKPRPKARLFISSRVYFYFTSTPMFLAVPSTIFIAALTSEVLRSGSFFSAIALT